MERFFPRPPPLRAINSLTIWRAASSEVAFREMIVTKSCTAFTSACGRANCPLAVKTTLAMAFP